MHVEAIHQQGSAEANQPRVVASLLFMYGLLWIWLAIGPVNRQDWFLENLLAVGLVAVLVLTYRRFSFPVTSYYLIAAFMVLHAIGAHYTYSEVPFGFRLKDAWGLSRNPFDRIVAQISGQERKKMNPYNHLNGVVINPTRNNPTAT